MSDPIHPGLTLTVTETSRLLRISRAAAYELVHSGALHSIRVGRRILVPRLALNEFLTHAGGNQ